MKSLIRLMNEVLSDMEDLCHVSANRDRKTISARFEREGVAFLTITLADFAKDFERGLELGRASSNMFRGFAKHGEIPRFLGGFLELVFDRGTGKVLDDPNPDAVFALRQICLMCAKIKLPTTQWRDKLALDGYIKCEQEIVDFDSVPQNFSEVAIRVWSVMNAELFSKVSQDIYEDSLIPRHGPGNTADGLLGNTKWLSPTWPSRLESVFPVYRYYASSGRHAISRYESIDFLEPGDEQPVKVTLVPKTQRTPRIIAQEPTAIQYAQQALLRSFATRLKESNLLRNLVSLDDQLPNREMAKRGSEDASLATLDLSEASDRVSLSSVERMLEGSPLFREFLLACRSTRAVLPDGSVMELKKFASMGSAMCFPIEGIFFLSLVVASVLVTDFGQEASGLPFGKIRQVIKGLNGRARVFGDDIIVPTEYVANTIGFLEAFGLKVNSRKSFWNGKFRESCGGDYFNGEWVTPVRLRNSFPNSVRDVEETVSLVSFRNQLYKAGLWKTVRYLDSEISALGPFPAVEDTSPLMGRHTFLPVSGKKMCSRLQRPMVKGMKLEVRPRSSDISHDGEAALLKWFLGSDRSPSYEGALFDDRDHLRFSGRSVSARIKYGWSYTY